MELKEFIKTALADITNAVKESQTELENGSVICPAGGTQLVEFDIAVTIESSLSAEAGAQANGVLGKIIAIGGKAGGDHSHTQLSRIRFELPVSLPRGDDFASKRPKRPTYD